MTSLGGKTGNVAVTIRVLCSSFRRPSINLRIAQHNLRQPTFTCFSSCIVCQLENQDVGAWLKIGQRSGLKIGQRSGRLRVRFEERLGKPMCLNSKLFWRPIGRANSTLGQPWGDRLGKPMGLFFDPFLKPIGRANSTQEIVG